MKRRTRRAIDGTRGEREEEGRGTPAPNPLPDFDQTEDVARMEGLAVAEAGG